MAVVAVNGLACLVDRHARRFLHHVGFSVHEAGHLDFGFFSGEFVGALSGTLTQLIMPIAAGFLYIQKTGPAVSADR